MDDHYDTLLVLSESLTYFGYEIKGISHGENLFEIIKQFNPDLLLLDFSSSLSKENVAEICKHIKNDPLIHTLPVILISAYPIIGNRAYGCDSVIEKPFDLDILLNTISANLFNNNSLVEEFRQ